MHELSVCQALVSQVASVARENNANRVAQITLGIGPLSGIEPFLLEQAYLMARAGTVAERAELIVQTIPVRVRCEQCGAESNVLPNRLLCGACGDWHTRLTSGDECMLMSVELLKGE